MRLLNLQLREGDPAIRVVMVEGFAVELEVTLWLEEERLQMGVQWASRVRNPPSTSAAETEG